MNSDTLDFNKLREIPRKNPTALLVLQDLSKRERNRFETDIDRNAMNLLFKGFKVNPDDYMNTWKALEEAKAGTIIWGRSGNPNRFRWHYSLKDVGLEAISGENPKDIKPLEEKEEAQKRIYHKKPKRGRPKGSKNKTTRKEVPEVSTGTSGLVLTVVDTSGKTINIGLEEAMKLTEKVLRLKQLVAA